jgi:hypothetical protein
MAIGAIALVAAVVLLLAGIRKDALIGEPAPTIFIGVSFGLMLFGVAQMMLKRKRRPPAGTAAGAAAGAEAGTAAGSPAGTAVVPPAGPGGTEKSER